MVEVGCEVLLLVDRLAVRAEVEALRHLAEGLAEFGHDCTILCSAAPADHGLDELIVSPGLNRRWLLPWAVRSLDLSEEPGKPRLIHVLSTHLAEAALAIAERWRIPYLLGVEEFPRRDLKLRLSREWCRGLVVSNRELAGALSRDFGVPPRAINQVDAGVEWAEGPPRETGRDPGRVPVVGTAGRFVADSGFGTFLNAARKVVDQGFDVEFLIAGHGDDEGDLRRKAERLRIAERLTFADDLPAGLSFWHVLDVYCQTSTSPTVGSRLLMAMAGGVPSISSDVEGLRSLVRPGETGLVVPPGDSAALAEAILELLRDQPRARSLGDAARASVLRVGRPDRGASQLDRLYREVLGPDLAGQASGPARRILDGNGETARVADEAPFPRLSEGS